MTNEAAHQPCYDSTTPKTGFVKKWEMIFIQQFSNNFLTTLSHTHIMFLLSLYLFLSILVFTNKNEKMKIVIKIIINDCTNITTKKKYW